MSASGSKSNERVAHFMIDMHNINAVARENLKQIGALFQNE